MARKGPVDGDQDSTVQDDYFALPVSGIDTTSAVAPRDGQMGLRKDEDVGANTTTR